MTNKKTLANFNKSISNVEKKLEDYVKNQEKMIAAIRSDINSMKSLISELESDEVAKPKLKTSNRKKTGSSAVKEPVDYVKCYQTFMSERTSTGFSDEDNTLRKFIDVYSISNIQEFCDANGIILKVSAPKNKLYGKIITAITENKRF